MPAQFEARFVGRREELTALRAAVDRVAGGKGALVAVTGDAGIGKTRIASLIAAEARERGWDVCWGHCHDVEGAPGYWPWVQVFRTPRTDAGQTLSSEWADLLRRLREGAAGDSVGHGPDSARFDLFDRVAAALGSAARERSLLIVLDDLHRADVGTLLLLRFLAPALESTPLLILSTLRDGEIRTRADAAPLFAEIARQGESVPLAGLGREEIRELLRAHRSREPTEAEVDETLGPSEGNPFLVREIAHLLDRREASGDA